MKRAVVVLAAGVLAVATGWPAWASTSNVEMTSTLKFDPTPISVAIGDTVQWNNDSGFTHTATSNAGWFNTGDVTTGNFKTKLFLFGGAFKYHCKYHGSQGMVGSVKVPDRWLNTGTQHAGDVQKIRIAAVAAPNGLAYDVQMRTTGGDWHVYKSKITNAVVKFTPSDPGEYQFRSRVHRLSNNRVSGYGPPAFVEISA
ncbi:MAG TPA: plastocyanin/azurin family copper-binding protein [Actinomycetota bacterium]